MNRILIAILLITSLNAREYIAIIDFEGESELVQPFYDSFFEAISQTISIESKHSTHCTYNNSEEYRIWDRKLDYLFTNKEDWSSTGNTHQDAFYLSDHAPVSATLTFP